MPDIDVRYSVNEYLGDGTTTEREINFAGGYLLQEHVKSYYTTPEGLVVDQPITFVGPNSVSTSPSAVPAGAVHTVYRQTPIDGPFADFNDGAVVSEKNLDSNARQAVFLAAEARDRFTDDTIVIGNVAAAQVARVGAEEAAAAGLLSAANSQTSRLASELAAGSSIASLSASLAAQAATEDVRLQVQQDLLTTDYFPGARTYVPQGATGHGAITGGSGGTNGTFALAFSSGNFGTNPAGSFTVAGGAVTAITLTGPGLYIGASPTAPTLSFAASAGLTGAAATLTIGYLIGAGSYYRTGHATDPYQVALFQNQANAAVEIEASVDWANIRRAIDSADEAESYRDEVLTAMDTLVVSTTQVIGRPLVSAPVDGNSGQGNYTFFMNDANVATGPISPFKFYCHTATDITLARYTRSGGVYTKVATSNTVAIGSTGAKTLTAADFSNFTIQAGEILAFTISVTGGITSTVATADGTGWLYAASVLPSSVTPTLVTSSRLEVSFSVTSTAFPVTAATFIALQSTVSADALAISQLSQSETQIIGRPTATPPGAGTTSAQGGYTYYMNDAVTVAGTSVIFKFYAAATGTMTAARYTRSGGVYTKVATSAAQAVSSTGAKTLTFSDLGTIAVGDIIAFNPSATGVFTSTATTSPDGTGWLFAASSLPASVTPTAVSTSRLEVSFSITGSVQVVTADAFAELQEQVAAAGSTSLPFALQSSYQISKFDRHGLHAYGQSNSVSHNATPLIDTVASVRHLMPNVGIVMTKPGISGGTNADDATETGLLNKTGITDPGGAGTAGESIFPWIAKRATPLVAAECGYAPKFWCSSAGLSSATLAQIGYGSAWYANLRYHWQQAAARAAAVSESYAAVTTCVDWFESDSGLSTPYATIKAGLILLIDGSASDRLTDYGQTQPMHWLMTTPSYNVAVSADASIAVMDLCEPLAEGGRADCHFVAPVYRFPLLGDNIHLTAIGQALKGCYYGRATAQLFSGRVPDRCRWLGVTAVGTALTAYIAAPTPVAFNTTIIGAATNHGIKVVDGTGTLTLSSLSAGAAVWNAALNAYVTPITATLHRTLGASPMFRYGIDYLGSGLGITNGASGNVFDTTTDAVTISGTTYSLAHAAPVCRKSIVVVD